MTLLLHVDAASLSWRSWSWEPEIFLGIAGLAVAYWWTAARDHSRARLEWWRPALFGLGLLTLFLALESPLDAAGTDYLLSAHMLQHMLLAVAAPPLLLLGLPRSMARRLVALPLAGPLLLALVAPVPPAAIFTVNMWLWHIPSVYQAALDWPSLHAAMHLAFVATGVLLWWPVIEPLPEKRTLAAPAKALYLFVTGLPMALLALALLASPALLYPHYGQTPRLWGISPLTDQQLAGLVMGALGEAGSFIAFSLLFLRFVDEESLDSEIIGQRH